MTEDKKQVDVLLDCTHIIILPVENELFLPRNGEVIICGQCHKRSKIIKLSRPYTVRKTVEE